MNADVLLPLGIALGLGLLVGLQRERAASKFGGIRTFPIITIFGAICGLLAGPFGGWVVAAGLLGVAGALIVANVAAMRGGAGEPGQTSEMAALLMFGVGAYVVVGDRTAAVVVGGALAVLLHVKAPLHRFVARIGDQDAHAIMRFVLISLVILPVLPDRNYGPAAFQVFNPRGIWMMVVLIVGLGLAGYVAYKLLGKTAGTFAAGVLGGLISSTATTVSWARRAAAAPGAAGLAATVVALASTVAFARVLVEIGAVAPASFASLAPPLVAMLALMCALSLGAWLLGRGEASELPEQHNPAEFRSALVFAGIYAAVLFAVAVAQRHAGSGGLYAVAVLSGLADMDAITLSTAHLVDDGTLEAATGWRVILVASMSNLAFKGGTVAVLAGRGMASRVALLFSIAIAGGVALLLLWPSG